MSESNNNRLPPEILIKLFRYLDPRNLKNATLTCKLWNHLIESSCLWSLKWTDYDNIHPLDRKNPKLNFILTTNRKFGKVLVIMKNSITNNEILRIFVKHGSNVVVLTYCCDHLKIPNLTEILNLTPNVHHAVIEVLDVSDIPQGQIWPNLKKMSHLELRAFDDLIIRCFTNAKLTTIKLWDGRVRHNDFSLAEFLSSQEMLTSLVVLDCEESAVLDENVPVKFRLTKLVIIIGMSSSHNHEKLLRFVESQAEHLVELELGWFFPSSVYEHVFSMPKLTTLSVVLRQLPSNNEFYEKLNENRSIRTLKFIDCGLTDDYQFFGIFLKKLPNIRTLICLESQGKFYMNVDILKMARNLSQLESLSFDCVHGDSVDYLKFFNLKELQIERLAVKFNWHEFTTTHFRLTELTIEKIDQESFLTSDDIDQITTNVDLQSIRLGAGFIADDRFFEIIRIKCTNLKVLDLHKSCISRISHGLLNNTGINALRVCDDVKRSNCGSELIE